ncbi:hypothetical protein BN1723_020753, partial [Verticillium longisporum]
PPALGPALHTVRHAAAPRQGR